MLVGKDLCLCWIMSYFHYSFAMTELPMNTQRKSNGSFLILNEKYFIHIYWNDLSLKYDM